ncbi:hypothetical protein [Nocardia implantans]|uniref:Transposase n=1 Tax=Nocardia implantans TaxID=3108168 RepID=A0ABU6AUD7_9NOCA|nr:MULTISPECIES: hypothetical protein [unclassified Nocardia]MBF6191111.1 hypothetical protein [Nocardia beijingensis]MEA3529109.1 hypothetical protein [Nocardia sp. CDC192]MEB3510774.1 hypothetical protein [Nocardia sp. CDC186]
MRRRSGRARRDPVGAEVDEIFGPSRKHIHERKEWVAIAKVDDRISGDDPLVDLDSGTVTLPARRS